MSTPWLIVCKNPECGHEWDGPTDKATGKVGPPGPGTRCPECLWRSPVALRPQDRAKSPKARAARAAEAEAAARVAAQPQPEVTAPSAQPDDE